MREDAEAERELREKLGGLSEVLDLVPTEVIVVNWGPRDEPRPVAVMLIAIDKEKGIGVTMRFHDAESVNGVIDMLIDNKRSIWRGN